jgi:hypothetical protein
MKYLALGDSISIDDYTGVAGGGAASQLARRIGAAGEDFQDLTRDGNTTHGVERDLLLVRIAPEVTTLTAGGNNLLMGETGAEIAAALEQISHRLARLGGVVILNTVYDPSDGDDSLAGQIGVSPALRQEFNLLNQRIREIAAARGFLLADLERLFHGRGLRAPDTWYVNVIEPNLAGATAIAAHWVDLLQQRQG